MLQSENESERMKCRLTIFVGCECVQAREYFLSFISLVFQFLFGIQAKYKCDYGDDDGDNDEATQKHQNRATRQMTKRIIKKKK